MAVHLMKSVKGANGANKRQKWIPEPLLGKHFLTCLLYVLRLSNITYSQSAIQPRAPRDREIIHNHGGKGYIYKLCGICCCRRTCLGDMAIHQIERVWQILLSDSKS